jgi:prepilin-type N-terminal cleavage/methylation domain-containing protein
MKKQLVTIMYRPSFTDSNNQGWTLVELALVLVIVGILVTMGAGMIGPLTKRVKMSETKEIINAAIDSVIGYAATNSRVPDTAQFPSVVRNQNDVYGQPIVYIYNNNLATSICDRTTTNISVRVCNDAACAVFTTVNNVAFMVMSIGENINNQTAGSQAVAAPVIINTYPAGIAVDNYAGDFIRATDAYDDIVKWVTLPELQTKASCSGCVGYEVYNAPGATTNDFRNNLTGACYTPLANTFITSISRGGSIERHTTNNTTCAVLSSAITYNNAAAADVNRNCQVNYPNALPLTDR